MALSDLQNFLRERLLAWNPSLDVSSGSPLDSKLVQPVLQRVGTDPFSVDAYTFMLDRLSHAFPELSIGNGDAVEDLVIKTTLLLWDPLIREIQRVKQSRSFNDPSQLSLEEAEELGSTFFAPRDTGEFSRGTARIYFAQPQQRTVTASNFTTSKGGLVFFPTGQQSIQANEMSLNREDDLYYFDISVVAQYPGDQYNIEPREMTSIANIDSAVLVSNKVRFRGGRPAEDAETYIARLERRISERSMVSNRGIAAVVATAVPEVSRLAVVGYQDPEMQRDVITGGGLGPVLLAAADGVMVQDGKYQSRTRRMRSVSSDFFSLAGVGQSGDLVLTVFGGLGPGASPIVQDFDVARVLSATELEVTSASLFLGASGVPFTLRKKTLTLSGIPGGILQPDGPNGTVDVPSNKIHVGGCVDIYARAVSQDVAELQIDAVADESPEFFGLQATVPAVPPGDPPWLELSDLVLGTTYQPGDRTHRALSVARDEQYVVQVLDGVIAGTYRILGVDLGTLGSSPLIRLDPPPLAVSPTLRFRWRLVTEIDLDLAEVKEIRVSGSDGRGAQNRDVFGTGTAVNLGELGVATGDVLRVLRGPAAGDYGVTEVIAPNYTSVRLNRKFPVSFSGTAYQLFRPNGDVGVRTPLLRITSAELLDSSGQPLGVKVPPALPVGVQSRGFANVGSGVKVTAGFSVLGLVSREHVPSGPNFGGGQVLGLEDDFGVAITVSLSGTLTMSQIAAAINVESNGNPAIGYPIATVVPASLTTERILITPFGPNTRTSNASTPLALQLVFGDQQMRTSRDIRDGAGAPVTWSSVSPALDPVLDVIRVLDGTNTGFYGLAEVSPPPVPPFAAGNVIRSTSDLAPDFGAAVQVGSRSFGTARLYYLEPTAAQIGPDTRFFATTESGGDVVFFSDTTVGRQVIPPLPGNDNPKDGVTSGTTLTSLSTDFIRLAREGDELSVDYVPMLATAALADPVPLLALKDLYISVLNSSEKVVTFVNDVGTPGAVSRDGVAAQLNSALGMEVASIVEPVTGQFYLKINAEMSLRVRRAGSANPVLGWSSVVDTHNDSPHVGLYKIVSVDVNSVRVNPAFPAGTVTEGQFRVVRKGTQRITPSEMVKNVGPSGLYYWDVELFSEGTGDAWNLPVGTVMTYSGVRGDGYYLRTNDENTSYSPSESVRMVLSRFILPEGVDDSPVNAVQMPGQVMRMSYEYSDTVAVLQGVSMSDTERVVNASPLARHLLPHYVRVFAEYSGGSREVDIVPDVQQVIQDTLPGDALEVSRIQSVIMGKGATSVKSPMDLVALVHRPDRSVHLVMSQGAIFTGRLSAFIPDRVELTRRSR